MHIDLGGGQADTFGVVHGFDHVGSQRADAVIHDSHWFGHGM